MRGSQRSTRSQEDSNRNDFTLDNRRTSSQDNPRRSNGTFNWTPSQEEQLRQARRLRDEAQTPPSHRSFDGRQYYLAGIGENSVPIYARNTDSGSSSTTSRSYSVFRFSDTVSSVDTADFEFARNEINRILPAEFREERRQRIDHSRRDFEDDEFIRGIPAGVRARILGDNRAGSSQDSGFKSSYKSSPSSRRSD